jgi:hypothetical protein
VGLCTMEVVESGFVGGVGVVVGGVGVCVGGCGVLLKVLSISMHDVDMCCGGGVVVGVLSFVL